MSAKKAARVRKPKANQPLGVQPDVPPPPMIPPGPPSGVLISRGGPSEFKDPDPNKPIKDILNVNGAPVDVTVLDGRNIQGGKTALVFVQNGQSSELLSAAQSKHKFIQDAEGTVYYGSHGFSMPPANTKPVDVVALAS